MRSTSLILLVWLFVPTLVVGQVGDRVFPADATAKRDQLASGERSGFHATAYLATLPEGRAALAEMRQRRAAGLLPNRESTAAKQALVLGAQQLFSVYNFKDSKYENIDFTLKNDQDRFTIWVETALLNGTVSDQKISELDAALRLSTPAGSVNPSAGIVVNDEVIFGDPPNKDGDSKTDILLLDVRDDPSQGFVILGFFDPRDQGSNGNQRDIVYLDTDPGLLLNPESLLATAAHEYQHLIMASYDGQEGDFVSEAQSEYAELLNGYDGRNMDFLTEPGEHQTHFFEYRDDLGGLLDRERGQLFTLYLAEQHGVQTAGAVTRQSGRSQVGYSHQTVLGSIAAFESLVADFHVANLLNDRTLGDKYGYLNPFYTDVRTSPDLVVDGRVESQVDEFSFSLEGGAVRYVELNDVKDPIISIDVNPTLPTAIPSYRARTIVRALLERSGTPMVDTLFTLNGSDLVLEGTYDRVTLVIVNGRAQDPKSDLVPYLVSAIWSDEAAGTLVSVTYDDGNPSRDYFTTDGSWVQTTEFSVPDPSRATLDVVSLAPFFDNQFGNSTLPTTDPRDIKLLVLDATSGTPDLTNEIFSLVIADPRPYSPVTTNSTLDHFDVDLSSYSGQLSNLPAEIFIGFSDTGDDLNYTVFAPANNSTDNVSHRGFTDNSGWLALWDLRSQDNSCCNHRVIPVRARFLVANVVGIEDDLPSASDATLLPNYPNPFSASTEIVFELAQPSDVEIKVFDVLGREVSTVVTGLHAVGRHTATIDGNRLSSGIYLYRLRAGTTILTRSMIRL